MIGIRGVLLSDWKWLTWFQTPLPVTPAKEAVRKSTKAAGKELQRSGACLETRPAGAPRHEVYP